MPPQKFRKNNNFDIINKKQQVIPAAFLVKKKYGLISLYFFLSVKDPLNLYILG